MSQLVDEHRAQLLNYLNATGFKLGLLVNFGHFPKLEYERIVLTLLDRNICGHKFCVILRVPRAI